MTEYMIRLVHDRKAEGDEAGDDLSTQIVHSEGRRHGR